jgi:membrane associated rhomboid family serine protease
MRYYVVNRGIGSRPWGGGVIPPAIKLLLFLNGGVFLLQLTAFGPGIVQYFGLAPAMVAQGAVWQLVTYMFLHGGFFHILINMFVLWMFGRDLENAWGSRQFLKFYMICGLGAGVVTLVGMWGQTIPTIGASGAIYGVLLAFGMTYPNRPIYLWFLVPIKAKYMVMIWGGLALINSYSSGGDGIAHITHLGGLVVGFIYLKWGGRFRFRLPRPFAFIGRWRAKRKARRLKKKWDDQRSLMEAVDRVLDRINEVGYDQLTDEEKATLERASRRLSTEDTKR